MDNPNNQRPRQSQDRDPQARRQSQQAQRRKQGARRQQASAGERRQQPAAARQQQPAARQSVRADAERQQQARQQAVRRQAAREQQQTEHRQQMREQTMREHQARMQAQRQSQGAAAYSASNYTARNSRRNSRRTAADDIRVAAQGGYTPQGNRIGQGGGGAVAQRPRSHRKRNIIIAVVAAIIVILAIPTVAFGVSAMGAKDDANTMMTQGKNLVAQIKAGDMTGAKATANDLSDTADKLHQTTDTPLWAAATMIPILGSDIKQVRALADVADTLSGQVLVPIVDGMPANGMAGILVDGGINVEALQNMLGPLGASSNTIHQCAVQMDNLGDPHLEQLKSPVKKIKSALELLDTVSEHATELSGVLPGLLGAQGQRTYLIAACTGAEIRSTGGFPGSVGIMTVENGRLNIGGFASSTAVVPNLNDENKIPVPAEEERIFGKRVSESFLDTTFIPNYPRAAQLMKEIWEKYPATNPGLDGIVCIDPVFLQRVLALTGGITTTDGTVVDGTNAAEMLMNTVYLKYEDNFDAQDALFAEVAQHALGQVFGNLGSIDITEFAKVLFKSFDDRRIYAWINVPNEQAVLEDMKWTNSVSHSTTEPETGIYVGCAMGAKIDWYLDIDTEVSKPTKNADGSKTYTVTAHFKNTLSEDYAKTISWYIVGGDQIKRTASDMPLDIYLYAPSGGTITNIQANGYFTGSDYYNGDWNTRPTDDPMTRAEYDGHEVWYGMTQIDGGTETVLTYTVNVPSSAQTDLKLAVTPLPNESFMK